MSGYFLLQWDELGYFRSIQVMCLLGVHVSVLIVCNRELYFACENTEFLFYNASKDCISLACLAIRWVQMSSVWGLYASLES
jgi:hypothetical protein